jgi:MFS family permease
MNRRALRKAKNAVFLLLSLVATMTGLACLAAILWTLLSHGIAGMSWRLFAEMTPPPGSRGGLLNALYGSGMMTLLGILIGSPIGVLAGTYLAEYGRNSRLSTVVRFINDVLLSAPSIIIGLFVYEIVVVRMGHFSAIAGALRLPVAHHVERAVSRGAQRDRHRVVARHRPHQRRDRAAALHGAQQSILEHPVECPDGESSRRHFPICLESLQGLAGSCVGGRLDHYRDHIDT